ncbi:MAG: sterol desaturase family protein [Acidobacteria bacterium]|nr:MAG: sterol desaturase family protein [Acidobacteriota bacterium]
MTEWIMSNEPVIRLGFFAGIFGLMAIWEILAARRELTTSKGRRWVGNLSLVLVDTLIVRLLFPTAAVGTALIVADLGWGVLNVVSVPYWAALLISVATLDLAIYLQHVMFHALPALWRLHMVHHADLDLDVTSGSRFHPIEIVLSMFIKLGVISVLGPPLLGVLIFEVVLNALAMFNHANARIPLPLDRVLRWIIVTPDMHRVHHSVEKPEHNTNFGFNLSCWDRVLGTYKDQPAKGHEGMIIGLKSFRERSWQSLPRLLSMPFFKPAETSLRSGSEGSPGEMEKE